MSIQLEHIRAFLNRPGVEGPQQLRGYIPCRRHGDGAGRNYIGPDGTHPGKTPMAAAGAPDAFAAMGVSGVTIATGVDLGQTDESALRYSGAFAPEESVIAPLRPYLGLRGDAALRALFVRPLHIGTSAANALDRAILGIHAVAIPARYDRDHPATPFADLPWQAQAAIFSLLFQRGTGAAGKAPRTWAAFVRGDWAEASVRLRTASFWDAYQGRRRIEGELLQELAI